MTHKELVEQVSSNLFKEKKKLETRKSWLAIRHYLQQLSEYQLKEMLKDATL